MTLAANRRLGAALASWGIGLWLSCPQAADAQGFYAGDWRAGTTRMDVAIESWGQDCGPRPQSSSSSGGGQVEITQQGEQLTIHAQGREIRSDACWSGNPGLRRVAASGGDGTWSTRCKTAKNDPRAEEGTYSLRADGDDKLLYRDVSRYNWKLKASECVATITTTQTLHRVGKAPTAAATEADAPACVPGDARRITLAPREAEIELGGQVCFRARVLDDKRCPLPDPPRLRLTSDRLKGELSGKCFRAGSNAAEAEGQFQVIASYRGLEATATVRVQAADLSALLAKRLETGAVTGFDQDAGEETAERPPPQAASKIEAKQGQGGASSGAVLWALLGVGALLLVGGAVWAIRRRRVSPANLAATMDEDDLAPAPRPQPKPAATPAPGPAKPAAGAGEAWICPQCRQGYPASTGRCPKDGTDLMPYAEFAAAGRDTSTQARHTCPKCGTSYPSTTQFCGKDGSPLGGG